MISAGPRHPDCEKGANCKQCQVPSKELWDQDGAVHFKFSTDEDFDRYLQSRCGLRLPKSGDHFMNTFQDK
jgi:hypothetical protein